MAQAELERSRIAVVEAQTRIVSAERTLQYHRARLEDTQIISPFDGLVTLRSREPGEVVVPGSPILDIVATDELWVSAWVDESSMSEVSSGQTARVIFRSEPELPLEGKVVRLGRSVDRESREFIVDVQVKQPSQNWAVGQRAEVYIRTARKDDVVTLPTSLVLHKNGRPGVLALEDGRARWRELSIGVRGTGTVEVVEGLAPGQKVIASKVREGQRISP